MINMIISKLGYIEKSVNKNSFKNQVIDNVPIKEGYRDTKSLYSIIILISIFTSPLFVKF